MKQLAVGRAVSPVRYENHRAEIKSCAIRWFCFGSTFLSEGTASLKSTKTNIAWQRTGFRVLSRLIINRNNEVQPRRNRYTWPAVAALPTWMKTGRIDI